MSANDSPTLRALQQRFPQQVRGVHRYRGQETAIIAPVALTDVMTWVRNDAAMAYDFLLDLTAVDYRGFGRLPRSAPRMATPAPLPYYMTPTETAERWARVGAAESDRFEVVYHLYASGRNHRLRVKVPLPEAAAEIPSMTGLWPSANWFEREVWDMFGIRFTDHPNLARLLMYEGFEGHPLRKDYPVNKRQPLVGPIN